MEEFKQRCLNQPYGDVGHLLRPLAYQTHPYRWPTIGKDLSHIANATLDEVKEFFFRFYAPNNAVLAVTGNISWEETIRLTEKWFAPIPRRNVPVRQLPQEVVQTAERGRRWNGMFLWMLCSWLITCAVVKMPIIMPSIFCRIF